MAEAESASPARGWSATGAVAFLVRAAAPFRQGGWIFTGFHWPVLAGALAGRLDRADLVLVYEAGAACNAPATQIPTSTTDVYAYAAAQCVQMTGADVLHALMRRFDCAVLDAANVDLAGRVNSTAVGPVAQPTVRLPGGGGAPDAMARARDVVLLHGGTDPNRIVEAVEHVTAAPASGCSVRLITRWGTVRLGEAPRLQTLVDGSGADVFLQRLSVLGVDYRSAAAEQEPARADLLEAHDVLEAAARRGYRVAVQAMKEHA